jgi:hypothetical protein
MLSAVGSNVGGTDEDVCDAGLPFPYRMQMDGEPIAPGVPKTCPKALGMFPLFVAKMSCYCLRRSALERGKLLEIRFGGVLLQVFRSW